MPIIGLSGFKGSGKSTLGKRIDETTGYVHRDVDHEIEGDIGPIGDYITKHGIDAFRPIESSKISHILDETPDEAKLILSFGGGAITIPENIQVLKDAGVCTIYLKAAFDILLDRIRNDEEGDKNREPMTDQQLYDLFTSRTDIYENTADIIVKNEGTIEEALYLTQLMHLRFQIDKVDDKLISIVQRFENSEDAITSYEDLIKNEEAAELVSQRNVLAKEIGFLKKEYNKDPLDQPRRCDVKDKWTIKVRGGGEIYETLHDKAAEIQKNIIG